MIVLAIDTSTSEASVALLIDGQLVLERRFAADRSHSASLFAVLEEARQHLDRADLIVVGLGPGSYAGIRIAIAAALGLELSLDAELVGLPSVVALETGVPNYLTIGDARRETFYWTRIEDHRAIEGPLLVSALELEARLAQFPGTPIFTTAPMPQFPQAVVALPSAATLARLAAAGTSITARVDLEPIYLREPHITQPKPRPK